MESMSSAPHLTEDLVKNKPQPNKTNTIGLQGSQKKLNEDEGLTQYL